MDAKNPFAWHVHHDVLLEPLTEPLETRQAYIMNRKPPGEQAIRLKCLKPVQGSLPLALTKEAVKVWESYVRAAEAWAAYGQAREAYGQAWEAYSRAWEAFERTLEVFKSEINVLHAAECLDCPWNGQTIFPHGA